MRARPACRLSQGLTLALDTHLLPMVLWVNIIILPTARAMNQWMLLPATVGHSAPQLGKRDLYPRYIG